jgi:hypothetical protein
MTPSIQKVDGEMMCEHKRVELQRNMLGSYLESRHLIVFGEREGVFALMSINRYGDFCKIFRNVSPRSMRKVRVSLGE